MARPLALLAFALCIGFSWADDDFWPPLDEEWRCLDQSKSRAYIEETHDLLINDLNPEAHVLKEQDIDCPIIDPLDPSWCAREGEFFPIKCNCHAYYRCFQLIPDRPRIPCIYKCWPYELVFDPNSKSCVMENQAPPGTCYATNVTHSTTTTQKPSPTTPVPTTTTTEPTTPKPTTTTPMTTTTTTTTTTKPSTTTAHNPYGCEYNGQKLPYPGDCHKYFRCVQDENNPDAYEVEVFSCDDWVFDPNQGSCVWPEIDNDLCP